MISIVFGLFGFICFLIEAALYVGIASPALRKERGQFKSLLGHKVIKKVNARFWATFVNEANKRETQKQHRTA